jgi:membrane protease YdiL (CAAX protease family)
VSETDASENGSVSGVRCVAAIFASVLAILVLTIIGGLSLSSGSAAWRLYSPVVIAIASAVLIVAVPGINAFSTTKPKFIAVAIAVISAIHLTHWNVKPEMTWIKEINSYSLHWQILVIPTICVISPIFEEIYFRGLLFPIIGTHWGPKTAAVITGIAFLALHTSLDVFLATLIYTLLAYYSRSVYPSITAHIAYNSMLFVRAVTWQS